jgi:serine phosphatase RsbU (regulator of sigma subunit)/anti-sigma regulatory factor (Ser/Thr protein kinase)
MFKNVTKEEIIIPAKMIALREIRDFIEQIGKKFKFSEKVVNSFKLVVEEACTNIIRHGYLDIKDGKITVRAIIRRLSLTIVIIDQGKSFDPRQLKNPDLQKYVQIGKKGGLGIFMMRKLMDDIQYHVTSHGNELRLTKTREQVSRPQAVEIWDSLTLRRKFFFSATSILAALAVLLFFIFNANIGNNVREDVFEKTSALTKNLAEISWNPLSNEEDLVLFQNAQAVVENHPQMIRYAFIANQDTQVVAVYPVNYDLIYKHLPIKFQSIEETLNEVTIFKESLQDTIMYHFTSPIQLKDVENAPVGFTVISITGSYLNSQMGKERLKLLIYIFVFLIVGIGSVAVLVTLITQPFHKLADWVRQVGRGTVDEDEIDIDASDELGEIAQAFNEMTSKFRQAQISLIEQQRLQKELQVAQEIQQMLLPDDFPDVIGYDIGSYYQAAKEVGGDLFDFVEVDDNSIGICVADVSGKGVPGSLVMTMIRTALRLEARGNIDTADVLTRVNSFVTDDIRRGMFVTMFYVYLDSKQRMVSFASAGHNPIIMYRGKTKKTYYLNPSGFPVGITLPDIKLFSEKIQSDRIRLHPDDILVLYTDGITEAMNAKRELYGEERFLAAIRKYGSLEVGEFVKKIKEDITNFTGGYEQNDDITFVAVKENMAAVDVKVDMVKELFDKMRGDSSQTVAEACKEVGISSTTYYRYKKIYEEGGFQLLREMLHGYTNLGLRHLSIEEKTKMYDIIKENPEFGPKKISDILNTEKYNFTRVSPTLIYEELRRAKLNTKELRMNFVERGGKRRLKPPGTPLLTLDGEVMVGFRSEETEETPFTPKIPIERSTEREKMITSKKRESKGELVNDEENEDEEVGEVEEKEDAESFNDGENESDNSKSKEEEIISENQKKNQSE